MSFTNALPPVGNTIKTGISFGISARSRGVTARLTFTAQAQQEIFNRPIAGLAFRVQVGRGQDEGRLLLSLDENGELQARGGVRGSASIPMKAWDLLPQAKTPAAPCDLLEGRADGLLIKLPVWTCPSKPGGKLDQEHGLKRSGGGAL